MKAHGAVLLALILCIFSLPSFAQTFRAQITGEVRDATGSVVPDIRTGFTRNVDVVLVKTFPFTIKDREVVPQFRAECYNLFNTPQFAAPNGAVTSQQFGTVTRQASVSRQFQFGLKIPPVAHSHNRALPVRASRAFSTCIRRIRTRTFS